MRINKVAITSARGRGNQLGFTLIELAIAIVIMLAGIVAVAQLVPASIRLNAANRNDSTALVFAQKELEAMAEQPLAASSFTDPQGVTCNLGNSAQPGVVVGSTVNWVNNRPSVSFSGSQTANYGFYYTNPNDPSSTQYDVRWAVITFANAGNATGKRFILGAMRTGSNAPLQPFTLDVMVQR